jgi:hypothetical protein
MAIVRTAKGTRKKATASASLVLTDVQLDEGACCVVGIAYRAAVQRTTTVTWGARTLKKRAAQYANNVGCELHIIPDVKALGGATRNIAVSWNDNTTNAAFFVTQLTGVGRLDEVSKKSEASTTAPDSGATDVIHYKPEMAIAAFASGGATSDDVGTPDSGFTLGQRDGTDTGSTDIVVVETYKELDTLATVTAGLTGAGSANWSACLITLHEVLKDATYIFYPAKFFEQLVVDQVTDGVNAWLLLCHASYNYWFLPETPSDDTLTELGMNLTEYQNARTRLSTEGIVTLESDGTVS